MPASPGLAEIVVCSLEPWDEVWRRNQFLADVLLRRNPGLTMLFVEPPADPLHDLLNKRVPAGLSSRVLGYDGRLRAFRPLKLLPRRAGSFVDDVLRREVRAAVRRAGLRCPTLWINDVTYAPLIRETGWSSVYDVTDDWLLAPFAQREHRRLAALEQMALEDADEVVVCSPALAESRGRTRSVTLIPNAVDVEHFRRPQPRPPDLPPGPVAVYVGSLHESRLDVDLTIDVARTLPAVRIVLVGPDSLSSATRGRLSAEPNVHLLGARPYAIVPGYLQHSDVIIVPHLVNEFTESLDPIKAYESLVAPTPTVATRVAGFRAPTEGAVAASRDAFPGAVEAALSAPSHHPPVVSAPSWDDRGKEFEKVLEGAAARDAQRLRSVVE